MDGGEEVSGGLVIAGRNRSVLLELAIEVLHEVARLVHFLIVEALNLSIAPGRDHEPFSCREQRLDDALIGIESLVCQQGVGLHPGQKPFGIYLASLMAQTKWRTFTPCRYFCRASRP